MQQLTNSCGRYGLDTVLHDAKPCLLSASLKQGSSVWIPRGVVICPHVCCLYYR